MNFGEWTTTVKLERYAGYAQERKAAALQGEHSRHRRSANLARASNSAESCSWSNDATDNVAVCTYYVCMCIYYIYIYMHTYILYIYIPKYLKIRSKLI